jgi:hypothetical protein
LKEAESERQSAERLLIEAKQFCKSSKEQAEANCREQVKKQRRIQKQTTLRKQRIIKNQEKKEEPKINDPEFSPSDAPAGWRPR